MVADPAVEKPNPQDTVDHFRDRDQDPDNACPHQHGRYPAAI
jgi:hypothetical protein